ELPQTLRKSHKAKITQPTLVAGALILARHHEQNGIGSIQLLRHLRQFNSGKKRPQERVVILAAECQTERIHKGDSSIHLSSYLLLRRTIIRTCKGADIPRPTSRCINECSPKLSSFPKSVVARVIAKPEKNTE